MDLKGILAISGYGGLFKLVKQTKNGFIVESLADGKRMQAFASSKISTLADIAIYTEEGEMPLKEVFQTIFEKENEAKVSVTSKSSGDELKAFIEKVLPDYDKERVYLSDIKKLVTWYNILVDSKLIDLEKDEKDAETDDTTEAANDEEVKEEEAKKEVKEKNENK